MLPPKLKVAKVRESHQIRSTKIVRSDNPLVRAYHEAGHVVIAKCNGWKVEFATIEADRDGSKFGTPGRLGVVNLVRDPLTTFLTLADRITPERSLRESDEWFDQQYRLLQRAISRYAQFAMGGIVATSHYGHMAKVRFAKNYTYGGHDDYQKALAVAACLYPETEAKQCVLRSVESAAKRIMKPTHWSAVERIANKLIVQRTLTGDELNAILKDHRRLCHLRKGGPAEKGNLLQISDGTSNGGTYVLKIRVRSRLRLSFGGFQQGKKFTIEPGDYSYVGSALGENGSSTLARRIAKHATRTGRKFPHKIRAGLVRRFVELGMIESDKVNNEKTLFHNVDHLLDRREVDLISVYAIRDPTCIEAALGRLIDDDPATSIIARRLGASDIPGNTHLLRVDADELWWRLLPLRMEGLATQSKSGSLVESYLRGKRCLTSRVEAASNGRLSFAKGTANQATAAQVAEQVNMPVSDIIKEAKFASAVDTIIANCEKEAVDAIFYSRVPQARKAIERIARTSDVRQRYRVAGVLSGEFRSIGPQCDDPVYDTVEYSEVTSRLGRAAGQLSKWSAICDRLQKLEITDVCELMQLCHTATTILRRLIKSGSPSVKRMPKSIERESITSAFAAFSARGRIIGPPKAALKLIVKNVWDYDEMQSRGIVPTPDERVKSLDLISAILATTTKMKTRLRKE